MPAFTNIIPKALALLIIYGQGAVIAPCAENTPPEKIYIIGYTERSRIHERSRTIVKQAYEKAGIKYRFTPLPSLRSLEEANAGVIDGEVGRIPEAVKRYKNLVRVNVPIYYGTGYAFTTRNDIDVYQDDLLSKYHVGYRRGSLWAAIELRGREADIAKNHLTLFKMLSRGRFDIALAAPPFEKDVQRFIKESNPRVIRLEPAVRTSPVYHFVHRKNAAIIPKLEAALRALQEQKSTNP
ncbi:hypothetical protein [Paremcibacter congregatus]|tara:strand:- start:1559 stop:2275 length:717 start_codon:yes stop_codon:yes gene_type:complete